MHIHQAPREFAVSRPRQLKTACEKLPGHRATADATEVLDRAAFRAQSSQWILAVEESVTLARIDLSAPGKDQEYYSAGLSYRRL